MPTVPLLRGSVHYKYLRVSTVITCRGRCWCWCTLPLSTELQVGGVQKCRASAAVDRQCSRPSAHTHARSSLVVVVVVGPLSLCSAKFRVRGSAEVQRAKAPTSLSIPRSLESHTHTPSIPRSLESPQGAQERNVQGGFLSSWVTLPFRPLRSSLPDKTMN